MEHQSLNKVQAYQTVNRITVTKTVLWTVSRGIAVCARLVNGYLVLTPEHVDSLAREAQRRGVATAPFVQPQHVTTSYPYKYEVATLFIYSFPPPLRRPCNIKIAAKDHSRGCVLRQQIYTAQR